MSNSSVLEAAMSRALELAVLGPLTGENPRVGCVILDGETEDVLAEGYHHGSGTPHAEIDALSHVAPGKAKGAIVVVSLEPCRHSGKTPPCVDALIAAEVGTVVYAVADPGEISGGGAVLLEAAGITVIDGVLADRAEAVNHKWLTAVRQGFPFVTVKFATTLDGRGAAQDGSSMWISGIEARRDAHVRRSQADAILVGTGTVLNDDPALTARKPDGGLFDHQPLPVIFGSRPIPPQARIFQGAHEPLVYDHHTPREALVDMFSRGIRTLIVEGGPTTTSSFIGDGLVNQYNLYIAPKLLGGWRVAITQIGANNIDGAKVLDYQSVERLGKDLFIVATPADLHP